MLKDYLDKLNGIEKSTEDISGVLDPECEKGIPTHTEDPAEESPQRTNCG